MDAKNINEKHLIYMMYMYIKCKHIQCVFRASMYVCMCIYIYTYRSIYRYIYVYAYNE